MRGKGEGRESDWQTKGRQTASEGQGREEGKRSQLDSMTPLPLQVHPKARKRARDACRYALDELFREDVGEDDVLGL